jgi:ribonuclease Z
VATLRCATTQAADVFRVTLLGTGDPIPRIDRFGPSTLIEVGTQKLLFDAGRGVTQRLGQLHIPLRDIDMLFLTHFHSDHLVGLPDLWLTGWLPPPFGRRATPLRITGPLGTDELVTNLTAAFQPDIKIRIADEVLPPAGIEFFTREFSANGIVYSEHGVVVRAFAVDHGALIKPAYGYRIEYGGHSVVISGDTRFDENLIAESQGADLLIHEVGAATHALLKYSEQFRRILDHHTTPEQAGVVFARVKPKLAVYTHFVLLRGPNIPEPTLEEIVNRTRVNYDGPLQLGEDLMSFEVGDTITIHQYRDTGPNR